MKPLNLVFLIAVGLLIHSDYLIAQNIGAPYNPDANADSLIGVPDMINLLPLFGQPFLPSDDDLDSTNEIQILQISGDTLFLIPGGGFVLLQDIVGQTGLPSNALSIQGGECYDYGGFPGVPISTQPDYTCLPELDNAPNMKFHSYNSNDPNSPKTTWRVFKLYGSGFTGVHRVAIKTASTYQPYSNTWAYQDVLYTGEVSAVSDNELLFSIARGGANWSGVAGVEIPIGQPAPSNQLWDIYIIKNGLWFHVPFSLRISVN
jgi:hypothetical protein